MTVKRLLLLPLALLLLGCPDESPDPPQPDDDDDDTVAQLCDHPADLAESPFRIVFPGDVGPHHPAPVLPSDFYLLEQDDGRLQASWDDLLIPYGLDHTDGFPTFLPILLPFTGPIDPATLTADRFLLFEVGGTADPVVPLDTLLMHNTDEDLVYLVPTTPLPEDALIAVAALTDIQSTDGSPLGRPAHCQCLLDGWDHPDYALLSAGVHAARDQLLAAGHADADLPHIATFHTAAPHTRVASATAALLDLAAQDAVHGEFTHVLRATDDTDRLVQDVIDRLPTDLDTSGLHPHLHTFVHGELTFPDVTLALDGGTPTGEVASVPFTVLVPPLEDGEIYRVVLYTHGIASCRETVLALSSSFLEAGYVLAAIDDREHYVRHDPAATVCEDDTYALSFIDMFDPAGTDTRFALTAMDQIAFRSFLETDLDDLLAEIAFESGLAEAPHTGTIHHLGHSLGGMIAVTAVASLPQAPTGALATANSGASMFSIVFPALSEGLVRQPQTEDNLLLYLEMATALPTAEVASHAPYVQTDFLLQAALDDATLPNSMSETLALTAGLPLLEPAVWEVDFLEVRTTPIAENLPSGYTGGLFQFDPAHHGMLFSSVDGDPLLAWRVQEQVMRFYEDRVIDDAYSLE